MSDYIILCDPEDHDQRYADRAHAVEDCAELNHAASTAGWPLAYSVYELHPLSVQAVNPLCAECHHVRSAHALGVKLRCTVATDKDGECDCPAFEEATDG